MTVSKDIAPLFSLVTAVHDVARYLPDFLASLDAQRFDHACVEVVAVDDGSTDDGLRLLREWAARTDFAVTVLTQPNAGQGEARNRGLDHARGTWVGFPDPDDVLGSDYLAVVAEGLRRHPEAEAVACHLLLRREPSQVVEDLHPLRYRFAGETRLCDLDDEPSQFFVSAPAGFYRRSRVEDLSLRFDPRVRPNFEDGHFGGRYLLALGRPLVLFVPEARYEYRKRDDGSSTLQRSLTAPDRWTSVFEHGYLDLLRRAVDTRGVVPGWLHQLLLYELSWLLGPRVRSLTDTDQGLLAAAGTFHGLMGQIAPLLDVDAPTRFTAPRFTRVWRSVVRHGWSEEDWVSPHTRVVWHDARQGLVCLAYHYRGTPPEETFVLGGRPVRPVHSTLKPFRMMGRTLVQERFVWLPLGERLAVRLAGRPTLPEPGPDGSRGELTPDDIPPARRIGARPSYADDVRRRHLARFADSWPVRRRFSRAWVLMDRIHDADDSAERLFEHLRAERPDINAWFVVERDTQAWRSLRSRFGRRVVAHGSRLWKLLLLNAEHVISTHADVGAMRPSALVRQGEPMPYRFTFLQHGVIKDDLSSWLNGKAIDVFVTSTQAEYDSIVGEDTNYVYTEREVVLTGLPRFDRLLRLGGETPPEERDLLLVCPTWRNWLAEPLEADSHRRSVSRDFLDSEFARTWLDLVCSEALAREAAVRGLRVVLLPHPNLQGHLDGLDLPEHVELMGFDGLDAQRVFARCALMVTDYSSMAFNAAYLDRPVVYYQFDRERMFGGDHIGVGGYFDYERDGFGPVTVGLAETVAAVADLLGGEAARERFAQRVVSAFPVRDGRCCERVVAAIEASTGRMWDEGEPAS